MDNSNKQIKTLRQMLSEISHAQQNGPGWYTRGTDGMFQQVQMWIGRGKGALDALEEALKPVEDDEVGNTGGNMDDLIEHWQNFLDALDDGCVEFNDSGMRSMAKRTIEALKPVEKLKGTCEKHPHLAVPVGCICHYCLDEERRICIQMLQAVVNKLQARIEELEERERWIPVSERFPENDKPVFAWFISAATQEGMVMPLRYNGKEWRDGAFTYRVTYWKPIHPPQEDD